MLWRVAWTMNKQTLALAKITTSTWGAAFDRTRNLYMYGGGQASHDLSSGLRQVWHAPAEFKGLPKSVESRLSVVQNGCLRMVSGAYRPTPIGLRSRYLRPSCVVSPETAAGQVKMPYAERRTKRNSSPGLQINFCKAGK